MDDLWNVLFVIGIIAIGFFKTKNKEENSDSASGGEEESLDKPMQPAVPERPVPPNPKKKQKRQKPVPATRTPQNETLSGERTQTDSDIPNESTEDFSIRSAEEARRAVILGEILNRKY